MAFTWIHRGDFAGVSGSLSGRTGPVRTPRAAQLQQQFAPRQELQSPRTWRCLTRAHSSADRTDWKPTGSPTGALRQAHCRGRTRATPSVTQDFGPDPLPWTFFPNHQFLSGQGVQASFGTTGLLFWALGAFPSKSHRRPSHQLRADFQTFIRLSSFSICNFSPMFDGWQAALARGLRSNDTWIIMFGRSPYMLHSEFRQLAAAHIYFAFARQGSSPDQFS